MSMSSSSKVAGWQEVRPIRLRTFWGAVDPPLGQKLARDGGALPRASGLWLGWDRLWGPGVCPGMWGCGTQDQWHVGDGEGQGGDRRLLKQQAV